ncbi:MAG: EamA family transporter [Nitrospinae bacterium]|nr:EamA family transporter [Nitrospinota bacterium]
MNDWRILALTYVTLAGFWGVTAKMAATRLDPLLALFIANSTAWVIFGAAAMLNGRIELAEGYPIAIVSGVLGALATIAFYLALKRGPATLVHPMASLYIALTVPLCWYFLGETLTLKHGVGIAFAIAAAILIAG